MLHANTPIGNVFLKETMTKTAGLFGAVLQVLDTSQRGPGRSLNLILLSNPTAVECAPMQVVKQPVTLESLKMLLLSDELWLIISVALLILL